MKNNRKTACLQYTLVLAYLLVYGLVSASFLELFPFVHSDEGWLAGLTLNMAEHLDFSVTESFFDARPRFPHAIKIIYHALQMVFYFLFGYSARTFRFISLLAGLLTLFFFYKTAKKLFDRPLFSFGLMVLFSFDIQFIYASHFARQEMLLLLSLVLCLYLLLGKEKPYTVKNAVFLSLVTGLSVGLHPNSFLIACMTGLCGLAYLWHNHSKNFKPLLAYIGATGGIAFVFVAISYCFDPQFITHYLANGALEFDINAAPGDRLSSLFAFFSRLFSRTGGTYYVADIRFQLLLFTGAFVLLFFFYLVMKKEDAALCEKLLLLLSASLGILAGIFIIGRYSQLSIVFFFPIGWLLVAYTLRLFERPLQIAGLIVLTICTLFLSIKEIRTAVNTPSHADYLEQISDYVLPESNVIGNLNMNFYFANGALHDYRNLPYVMDTDGCLDTYIEKNNIEYIFYTDELTYYFEHRPYYNTLYGNIMFAEALLAYCREHCELVGSFENPQYAPRILELIGNPEYGTVYVYRVK